MKISIHNKLAWVNNTDCTELLTNTFYFGERVHEGGGREETRDRPIETATLTEDY